MTAVVLRGDAAALPLPGGSVDLIVTSPPYHQLRAYQDGGEAYAGQIGAEETPEQYVDALIGCTREWVRCLKPTGSLFLNLGDAYSNKGLRGLPWRYAIRCVDQLGLILRAEIIWAKPNGLPESVTDRVRRSHEQVFHFVKQPRYYSAVDEVREAYSDVLPDGRPAPRSRYAGGLLPSEQRGETSQAAAARTRAQGRNPDTRGLGVPDSPRSHLGKLPGSVWTIPTAPLQVPEHLEVDHFAAFPPELVKRIVAGWSPRQVCSACREGRRPVTDKRLAVLDRGAVGSRGSKFDGTEQWHEHRRYGKDTVYGRTQVQVTGYACGCPVPLVTRTVTEFDYEADGMVTRDVQVPDPDWRNPVPTTPGIVVDPFGGTGTTALVASCLGRVGITVDMSADYCRLARWRTSDPGERARVLEVPKPEKPVEGQLGLFEGLGA